MQEVMDKLGQAYMKNFLDGIFPLIQAEDLKKLNITELKYVKTEAAAGFMGDLFKRHMFNNKAGLIQDILFLGQCFELLEASPELPERRRKHRRASQ